MVVFQKGNYNYNFKINENYLRGLMAFLITMYEFDFFSKIMLAMGLPDNEKKQAEFFCNFTKTYILRWIPGMLTSRYIMARDFIRATPAKSALVRYNLRYMRTTVLKLHYIPDLLIFNIYNDKVGAIVAKEAVIMKLPAIGLFSNLAFPYKIAFKYYGNALDFNYIKSFLYILIFAMETGKSLYENNNFCDYNKGLPQTSNFFKEVGKIFLIKYEDLKDIFVHLKQFNIYDIFVKQKNKYMNSKILKKMKFNLKTLYKYLKIKSKNITIIKCESERKLKNLIYNKKNGKRKI